MNLSGIVVTAAPARVPEVAASLAACPGVEVSCTDAARGHIVVVQERANVADEMDGLRAIQRLPGVISADLVAHYFEDESRLPPISAAELARRLDPATDAVPPAAPNSSKSRGERHDQSDPS